MTRGISRPRLRGLIRRHDAPPRSPSFSHILSLSLFIFAGGMTERVLSSRYGARAAPIVLSLAITGHEVGGNVACRTRRVFDARIARSPRLSRAGMSPGRSHETVT